MKRFQTGVKIFLILLVTLLLSGCSNKPFLTPENTYAIITISNDGMIHNTPVNLPWNINQAVLQKLLVEASFVLSDLHTASAITSQDPGHTIYLQTTFPQSKKLLLNIDNLSINMEVQSIQIEVQGPDVGRVILNQSWMLQGIYNPNLSPAFSDFMKMLQEPNQKKVSA